MNTKTGQNISAGESRTQQADRIIRMLDEPVEQRLGHRLSFDDGIVTCHLCNSAVLDMANLEPCTAPASDRAEFDLRYSPVTVTDIIEQEAAPEAAVAPPARPDKVWVVTAPSAYRMGHTCFLGTGPTKAAAIEDAFGPRASWGNASRRSFKASDIYEVTADEAEEMQCRSAE